MLLERDLGQGIARGVALHGNFISLVIEGQVRKSQFMHDPTTSFSFAAIVILAHLGCQH